MNSKNLNLWIDASNGRLYDGWNSNNNAEAITFRQGDKVSLELHLVRKSNTGVDFHDEVTFPDNCIVRVAVGLVDSAPTDGTWTATFGADTATIPYNATELQANTLINAMASVTAAGGVTVNKLSNTIFKVDFLSVGVRPAMTLDATGLTPVCTARRIPLKVGSATARDSFTIKVYQTPVAFQGVFVDAPDPVLSVTTLTTNKERRISLSPTPRAGSLAITSTANILPFQDADLANASVSYSLATHWARMTTTRINVSQPGVSDFYYPDSVETDVYSRGKAKFQSNVTRISDAIWDLTLSENTYYNDRTSTADQRLVNTVPVGYTFPVNVTAAGILKFNSKIGVLSFDTAEVEYLLSGQQSVSAILEIEVQDIDNNRWTVLQTPCTVTNDLIDQTAFNPISYENSALADAPSDGSQYARKNGSWQVVTAPDVAANWGNIGGTLSSQTDLSNALGLKADLSGATFSGTIYTPEIRNLLNTDLVIDSYNDTGAGTHYEHKFTPFDGKFVLATNGGGLTFPDSTTQITAGYPASNPDGYIQDASATSATYGRKNGLWETVLPTSGGTLTGAITIDESATSGFTTTFNGDGLQMTGMPFELLISQEETRIAGFDIELHPANSSTGIGKITFGDATVQTTAAVSGDRYLTTSTTSNAVSNGNKTFTIGTGLSYTPTQNITISFDTAHHMHGEVLTYNSGTGVLTVDIKNHTGAGTYSTWVVNVGGVTPATSVAFADITGAVSGNTNLQAAFDLKANLNGATFTGNVVVGGLNNTLPMLRVTQTGTGHSLVVEDATNPDTSALIVNASGVVGIGQNPATWVPVAGVALDVIGKVNTTTTATTPSLNLGAAITSGPTSATNGDIWITNAASPKFAYRTGGVNYYPAVANQFNTFSAGVAITSTSTTPQLTITQLGAGHALVVEDATSPDTTSFVVNNAGNVGVGVNPSAWFPTEKLDINGYATSASAPFADESTKLATTANVKASIRGSVVSVGSSGWALGYGSGYPNQIVRVYDDSPMGQMIVPTESPEYIPVGTQYVFIQTGTYSFTIATDGGGVQLRSFGNKFQSAGQHAVCTLIKTAVGEWYLAGNLA